MTNTSKTDIILYAFPDLSALIIWVDRPLEEVTEYLLTKAEYMATFPRIDVYHQGRLVDRLVRGN